MRFGPVKKTGTLPLIIMSILFAICVSSILYVGSYAMAANPTVGAVPPAATSAPLSAGITNTLPSSTVAPLPAGTTAPSPAMLVIPRDEVQAQTAATPGQANVIPGQPNVIPGQSNVIPGQPVVIPSPAAGNNPLVPGAVTVTPDPAAFVITAPTPQPSSYNFSRTSSKNTPCDVILILGDSRACSLIKALWDNNDYESLYYYADRTNAIDAICRKGNRMIVICAEPGGSIKSGAVDRAVVRLNSLLNNNANLQNQKSYTFFNMFGLNDCLLDGVTKSGYVSYDTKLIGLLPYCNHVYQLNAGPVSKNSEPVPDDELNTMIDRYNQTFKTTPAVTVVDLYTFLMTSGYHTEFSQIDVSGLHYDATTNVKIMNYILGVAYNAVGTAVLPGLSSPLPTSALSVNTPKAVSAFSSPSPIVPVASTASAVPTAPAILSPAVPVSTPAAPILMPSASAALAPSASAATH